MYIVSRIFTYNPEYTQPTKKRTFHEYVLSLTNFHSSFVFSNIYRVTSVQAYIVACVRSWRFRAGDDFRFLGGRNPVVQMNIEKESTGETEINLRL